MNTAVLLLLLLLPLQGATLLFGTAASAVLLPRTHQRPLQAMWPQALMLAALLAGVWHLEV
jgi:hypothetical protein